VNQRDCALTVELIAERQPVRTDTTRAWRARAAGRACAQTMQIETMTLRCERTMPTTPSPSSECASDTRTAQRGAMTPTEADISCSSDDVDADDVVAAELDEASYRCCVARCSPRGRPESRARRRLQTEIRLEDTVGLRRRRAVAGRVRSLAARTRPKATVQPSLGIVGPNKKGKKRNQRLTRVSVFKCNSNSEYTIIALSRRSAGELTPLMHTGDGC
jgi:hypothetical protein